MKRTVMIITFAKMPIIGHPVKASWINTSAERKQQMELK